MNHNSANPSSSQSLPLCANVSRTGRRCRFRVVQPDSPFCRSHARIHRRSQTPANPLADLPPELTQFASIDDVTRFLSRVLTLLAENRISPRRAAVLAYIANSLLSCLRASNALRSEDPSEFHYDLTGFPRPDRSAYAPPGAPAQDANIATNNAVTPASPGPLVGSAPGNPHHEPSNNVLSKNVRSNNEISNNLAGKRS